MQKIIKQNFEKIIILFILTQPLLDLITSISINVFNLYITLGTIVRLGFLAFVLYSLFFVYKKKDFLYITLILIYLLFFLFGVFLRVEKSAFINETQGALRTFYFPLLLYSLYLLKDEIRISIRVLFYSLLIYLVLVSIPNLLGISFKSYDIAKTGGLGFFNSANEISAIISILTPIAIIYIVTVENHLYRIITCLIYLITVFTLGTKTPILSLVITMSFIVIFLIKKLVIEKKYKELSGLFVIFLTMMISVIVIVPSTAFYKNIKTHLEYLEIDSLKEVLTDYKHIDHFIFSERLKFLDDKSDYYQKGTSYEKAFGVGYYKGLHEEKMIEIDYFDIYYSHGYIGFMLFFSAPIYIVIDSVRRDRKKNFNSRMLSLSLFLIFLLAFFTGHVLNAPAVSIFVICLMILKNKEKLW